MVSYIDFPKKNIKTLRSNFFQYDLIVHKLQFLSMIKFRYHQYLNKIYPQVHKTHFTYFHSSILTFSEHYVFVDILKI